MSGSESGARRGDEKPASAADTHGSESNNDAEDRLAALKRSLVRPRPKRFYQLASVARRETGYAVVLDERSVRTPGRNELAVPSQALAEAIAAEWNAQGAEIDIETMPATKLANTAIDRVCGREAEVAEEIVVFAGSDMLCYRSAHPRELVALQTSHWDPVLAWARETLHARFVLTEGVTFATQPASSIERVRQAVLAFDAFALTGLHNMTTLAGSVLLALAHANGGLDAEKAWQAAHVDEDWQISQWGGDAEAQQRRARRWMEFEAASRFLTLSKAV